MCLTLGQVVAAQFPTKLANYAEQLVTQKNDFQVAMVMQIARDVDMMSMWVPFSYVFALLNVVFKASMTSDDFLRKRLGPADQQPLDDGCLEGTAGSTSCAKRGNGCRIVRQERHFVDCRRSWCGEVNDRDHNS